jgi:hypothetical protein
MSPFSTRAKQLRVGTMKGKIAELRREFEAFLEQEKLNLMARNDARKKIENRITAIEKTLERIESRVAKLEGKNEF